MPFKNLIKDTSVATAPPKHGDQWRINFSRYACGPDMKDVHHSEIKIVLSYDQDRNEGRRREGRKEGRRIKEMGGEEGEGRKGAREEGREEEGRWEGRKEGRREWRDISE